MIKKMRLFKFLVISNEVMGKSKMVKIPRVKDINSFQRIKTKNEFFLYNKDLEKIHIPVLNQYNVGKQGMVLMSLDYPNETTKFGNGNKAYVIIDSDNIDNVMKAIAPADNNDNNKFKVCSLKMCNRCMELTKSCRNKNICIDISPNEKRVRGKTWSFANDKAGTKSDVNEDLAGNIITRKIEPKTGGIAYSPLQWESGIRPEAFKGTTIAVPLHHWIKCKSIPKKPSKKNDYSFYHIGHIFDYRKEFIGLATKKEQESLRKEIEPNNNIRRGRRVLAGQQYLSRTLQCDCGLSESNPKCRDCSGVLYIDTEQGLVDLYNQLISDEYRRLREGKTI